MEKSSFKWLYPLRWFFWVVAIAPVLFLWLALNLYGGALMTYIEPSRIAPEDLSYLKNHFFEDDSGEVQLAEYTLRYRIEDSRSFQYIVFEITPDYYDNFLCPNKEKLCWLNLPWDSLEGHENLSELEFEEKKIPVRLRYDTRKDKPIDRKIIKHMESRGRWELIFNKGTNAPDAIISAMPLFRQCTTISASLIILGFVCKAMKGKKIREKAI